MECTTGEGFGMPTAEAMLCNVPVIGSLNTSTKELIELSMYNFGINCTEIQYLAQSYTFEHMVEVLTDIIINGVEKSPKLRESIEYKVNPDVVSKQWFDTLMMIKNTMLKECRIIPQKGSTLNLNAGSLVVVGGSDNS